MTGLTRGNRDVILRLWGSGSADKGLEAVGDWAGAEALALGCGVWTFMPLLGSESGILGLARIYFREGALFCWMLVIGD